MRASQRGARSRRYQERCVQTGDGNDPVASNPQSQMPGDASRECAGQAGRLSQMRHGSGAAPRKTWATGGSGTQVDVRRFFGLALHVRTLKALAIRFGEAGNTQYDPASGHLFVNVRTRGDLAEIDPATDRVVARHRLPGANHNHGLLIEPGGKLAFIACEGNAKLLVLDMQSKRVVATEPVGNTPDVLAFDPSLSLLYVASESGVISVFQVKGNAVRKIWEAHVAKAHTVAVDPGTHQIYLPLENVDGKPLLRIMQPAF